MPLMDCRWKHAGSSWVDASMQSPSMPWSPDLCRRDAEDDGEEILGVVHSHTHTEGYPSPTDIRQAPDPQWHYVIISLRDGGTAMRSYKIVDGAVIEEPILVNGD